MNLPGHLARSSFRGTSWILTAWLLGACGALAQPVTSSIPEPAAIAGLARRGLDAARVRDAVRATLDRALSDGAFPGAIAVVGTAAGVVAEYAVGTLDAGESTPPTGRTLWDLASLTKVVATTSAVMILAAEGRIDVDAPVQRYLPEWRGPDKARVRVRHLLSHSSGLPAWRPLYKEADTPAGAMHLVLGTPLDTTPGARMVYSDLGAILLGEIVARVSGQPLDRFVARRVFSPSGMTATLFRPARKDSLNVAPTEYDPWRQRKVRGEVHDENAFRLGGVSAHAGLFSSAADLARFARLYLNHGSLGGRHVLDSATIDSFTARQDSSISNRALGWETPGGGNSAGTRMSRRAFGHTGFTGTSIWMDPANDVFVILLSNRVNPTRENRRISQVRVALADAVLDAFGVAAAGSRP